MAIRGVRDPTYCELPVPKRFLRFSIVGLSGVVVNYATYLSFTRLLAILEELALIGSIAASIFSNYLLNEQWTFRDRRSGAACTWFRRLGRFYLVSAVGAVAQWLTATLLYREIALDDRVALGCGILIATTWNFAMNVLWTWGKHPPFPGQLSYSFKNRRT